jgi:exosortase
MLANPLPRMRSIRHRLPLRAIALVGVVLAAYNYSLVTLVGGLTLQTPLAYLALVPIIAFALGWVQLSRLPAERPIHDRQLDYILGVGLILLAAAVAVLLPLSFATRFWVYRLDLLSLPLFVAGLVALFYGARKLWALKFPIAFLLLAWPVPYLPLVGDWMQTFTDATVGALAAISHVIPIARSMDGEGLFAVARGGGSFPLSVGSACAGVNSLVGFILVGTALGYVVGGPILRRVLWLLVGLVLIWLLNIVRIEAIFLVGAAFGQATALDVLHPVAGLIVFNIGVFVVLWVAPLFGLTFSRPVQQIMPAFQERSPIQRIRPALALSVAVAIAMGFANAGYARYAPLVNPLGVAQLHAFDIRQASVAEWNNSFIATFAQGKQYFGTTSTWQRIQYTSNPTANLQAEAPVYIDVINTQDAGTLDAYGLQACYRFHGFRIESLTPADIGIGVPAQVIDYHNSKTNTDWSALWWEWPYQQGGQTWYERIVVFIANGPSVAYRGGAADAPPAQSERFTATNRFLVSLAREMVRSQLSTSTES